MCIETLGDTGHFVHALLYFVFSEFLLHTLLLLDSVEFCWILLDSVESCWILSDGVPQLSIVGCANHPVSTPHFQVEFNVVLLYPL